MASLKSRFLTNRYMFILYCIIPLQPEAYELLFGFERAVNNTRSRSRFLLFFLTLSTSIIADILRHYGVTLKRARKKKEACLEGLQCLKQESLVALSVQLKFL